MTGSPLNVVLLGATGALGTRAAGELARAREVGRVVIAGRDRGRLGELHEMLGGPEGKSRPAVVHDDAGLRSILEKADVAVSCAGPAELTEPGFVEAAIAMGVPYTSLCDDVDATLAARRSGGTSTTVVLGCGLRPGLTNLLLARAAAELDEVESASVAVAGSSASDQGPATDLHLLRILDAPPTVVADGRVETRRAQSSPQLVYFPDPVGWVETFRCAHPEIHTLHDAYPGIRHLEWRFGLAEKPAMDALRAAVALGFGRSEGRRRAWLRLADSVRPLFDRFSAGRGGWSGARVDAWGTAAGHAREVSLAVVDHLGNLAGLLLTYVAVGLGAGHIHRPGVWAPEDVLDAGAALHALSRKGVRVARLEPAAV